MIKEKQLFFVECFSGVQLGHVQLLDFKVFLSHVTLTDIELFFFPWSLTSGLISKQILYALSCDIIKP